LKHAAQYGACVPFLRNEAAAGRACGNRIQELSKKIRSMALKVKSIDAGVQPQVPQ
jgi:hypothetical protein